MNRAILLEGLPAAGFTKLSSAGGAYYIWADVSHLTGRPLTMRSHSSTFRLDVSIICGYVVLFQCHKQLRLRCELDERKPLALESAHCSRITSTPMICQNLFGFSDAALITDDSVGLCKRILETTGVAIVPGVDFDRERGLSFVRFSFCGRVWRMFFTTS